MHPLAQPPVLAAIAAAVTAHRGHDWTATGFTDLDDRASHRCGIVHGEPFPVFAKLGGFDQSRAELRGLELVRSRAPVPTADPIGVIDSPAGWILVLQALAPGADVTAIGRTLALMHQVRGPRFGLAEFDGFFGPLPQDNRPVSSPRWADFFAERRLVPALRSATDSGHLPETVGHGVSRLIGRLPELCGPQPQPSLLHGDAQQNNFVGAAPIDMAPYYGHPEVDLALIDYFTPVPDAVFDAYRDVAPIDTGFASRRELWRLPGYLAVVTADGGSPFGRPFVSRVAEAVAQYR